jgi:hypothetical protein
MVANNLIDPSGSIVFFPSSPKPSGPIKTPERIKPMMAGILTLRRIMGDSKIMKSISEKINTGFWSGR